MRPIRTLLAGMMLAAVTTPTTAREIEAPIPDPAIAAKANNAFAFDLYHELAGEADAVDNLFFSPISIAAALSLTYEGSQGGTQAGFEQVLHVPEGMGRPGYHAALSALLGTLDGEEQPYELSIANSLWGEQTMPFRPAFLDALDTYYEAAFEPVDFIGAPEQQRQRINAWVEQQTQQRIKDLLPDGSISPLTRLVLANAIYFKGPWLHQFNPELTSDRPFFLPQPPERAAVERELPTPTMLLPRQTLRFADLDGLDVLELPYKGASLSMLILLPDARDGLAGLEAKLSAEALDAWAAELEPGDVRVLLPKWQATVQTDPVPALVRLGLADAFDPAKADFTGVSDSAEAEELYISAIYHKAFIKVDEEGSEAAAATAVVIERLLAQIDEPFAFTADHPFVYLIRDNQSGAVLFLGRVVDPS